ncbi:MAG: hypothetical protein AB1757_08815 [Acidobacteriota bacterium]
MSRLLNRSSVLIVAAGLFISLSAPLPAQTQNKPNQSLPPSPMSAPEHSITRDNVPVDYLNKARAEAAKAQVEENIEKLSQVPPEINEKPLTDEQKKYLAGSAEDRLQYAQFLKQSNTGLIRLLPKVDYETSLTVSATAPEQAMPIRGGGAFYSFGKKTHVYGFWSDLGLQENIFLTQVTRLSLGLFTALGDVALESVTLQTSGVEYLHKLNVPTRYSEASAEAKRYAAGFKEGNFSYRSGIRVVPGITYVLRSITYKRPDFIRFIPGTTITISPFNPYQGADIIVAFRVIRQEESGAVTILWKRLKKSSAPEMKRDKK